MKPSLASRIHEANEAILGRGQAGAVRDFFARDYRAHLTDGATLRGPAAVERFVSSLIKAFPDLEVEVDILVEGADRISWQRTLRGTQQGTFRGFPAAGQPIVWRDMVTSRFEEGLIVEDWSISDLAEQLLRARKRP